MDLLNGDRDGDGYVGPRKLSRLKNTSSLVMLAEFSRANEYNVIGYASYLGINGPLSPNTGLRYATYKPENGVGFHNGTSNYSFCDGSAKPMKYQETINLWEVQD